MDLFDELLERPEQRQTVNSIMRGIVKENWDEKNQGRVKVEFYMGEAGKRVSSWIPVAMPYTGNKAGFYMLPEVGTEVVVGFEMGNPDCPIVIGSLWNSKSPLPDGTAVKENTVKRIKTAGGHEILLSEEKDKGSLQMKTPKELTIRMEDENQRVVIQNKEGDTVITLDGKDGKLSLDARTKLELKVGGTALVTLEKDKVTVCAGTVSVEGKQSLKLESQSAGVKANMTEIKADSSLKLQSGGMAEIKGSMVKIN